MTESGSQRPTVDQRVVDIVDLLGRLVAGLRRPLLIVSVVPVVPILVILICAATFGSWWLAAIGLLGLVPSAWLTVRRRQLVMALQPPAVATAELRATFSPAELGEQLRSNLQQLRGKTAQTRPRKLAVALWRGVKLGTGTYSQLTDAPRLAPFLPGRLRGLAVLIAACLASAIVESVLAVLALIFASLIRA